MTSKNNGRKLSCREFLRSVSGTAAAGLLLAACAPIQTGTTTGAQPSEAESTQAEAPAPEAAELSLMMVDYTTEGKQVLDDEIIPAFDMEGTTIKANYTSWERYNEEMTTAFAGGVTPDVFQGGAVWTPQMAKREWALPLDDYIASASPDWDWDDFFPAVQDDSTINGKVYSVPYRIDIRSFWYRQDHLDEAGIEAPPTNWEELREAAIALTQREGDKIVREGFHYSSPGGWQNDLQPYMYFMEMAGGRFLSEDLSHCTLNEPPAVEALEYIHQLIVEDKVQPYPGFEAQGDLGPLESGQASMTMDSAFLERRAQVYAPDQLDHLMVTLPLSHKIQATHVWVNKFFMSSLSKDPDRAWRLLEYLTSKPALEQYLATSALTPPRRSLGEAEFMTDRMKILLASTEFAQPYPKHHRLIELFRPLAQNLEKCFSGQISPAEAMQETATAIDAIIAEG